MSEENQKIEVPIPIPDRRIMLDRRLISPRYYRSALEADVPETVEEHRRLKDYVRRQIRLSAGLEPMVQLSVFNPQKMSERIYENVRIIGIRIETLPGLYLTGSLFMPEKVEGKRPAILCPHGHWETGRIHHDELGGVVMRCFEFARMGFIVFASDMVGFNENNDLPHYFSHELKRRGDLSGVSTFGMQCLNSMRALDFLESLPEVDRDTIACTGASGGASQTWFIAALDSRIKAVAPVCMLSAHFQGGCGCEEGPLLRLRGLSSFDILASLAPMPMILPSVTGDWTCNSPWYEIPKLRQVYGLYNAEHRLEHFHYEDQHNYNRRTREHIYAWFSKLFLGIDRGRIIPEEEIAPPAPELLWHDGCKPAGATPESTETAIRKMEEVFTSPALDQSMGVWTWKNRNADILRQMIGPDRPTRDVAEDVLYAPSRKIPGGTLFPRAFERRNVGDLVCVFRLEPDTMTDEKRCIVLPVPGTCQEFFDDAANLNMVEKLMKKGIRAVVVELLGSGCIAGQLEHAVRDDKDDSMWTTFEHTFFSMRVQDIVTTVVKLRETGSHDISICAFGKAVPPALAASVLLCDVPLIADLAGLDESLWEEKLSYQPLIKKIGGLAGLVLLNAANAIFIDPEAEMKPVLLAGKCRISEKSWHDEVIGG
ncbi:MAG: acetylxylan esterase [Lentisphaeria bacterium]|nr:acetylxylan esterase [Lentisphaeria bacterium]